jgi:beta-RFAP synthase
MIRVQAPSRLHFGLLSVAPAERWPDYRGAPTLPARRFGSVGLMIAQPGVRVAVVPAAAWSAEGPLAERALGYARRTAAALGEGTVPPQRLIVEQCAPEHVGLGTGTQLGLAVARALCAASGQPDRDVLELARYTGRGRRSALGIHGFARGGFLVEAGQRGPDALAPLIARLDFPEPWRIVLVLLRGEQGLHGLAETQAFQQLQAPGAASAATDALCRLVLLGMLPAVVEGDLEGFGEALFDFNVRVGELFAPVQGGCYASPRLTEVVDFVRQLGVRGVGQSSWGPALFAVTADPERAADLAARLQRRFALTAGEVLCTAACNRGASCDIS